MKKITLIIMITLIAIAIMPMAYAQQTIVTRDIPDSVATDTPITITLNVDVDEDNKSSSYIITEYIPSGFIVTSWGSGDYNGNRIIKWLVMDGFLGGVVKNVTYTYTIQTSIRTDYELYGDILDDGGYTDIAGDTSIHLAENDADSPNVGQISPTTAATDSARVYSADVSDNIGVTSCNLFVDGINKGAMILSANPCTSCTASKSYTFTGDGNYSLHARCFDDATNSANGVPVTVEATGPVIIPDTEAPTVGIVSPTTATTGVEKIYTATVSDNVGVVSCNLFVEGVDVGAMALSSSPCTSCTASISHTLSNTGSYSFYTECFDGAQNSTQSTLATVIAADIPKDTISPIISNVQISAITTSSATVSWTTDEASNSVVEYGTTTSYGLVQTNPSAVTSHSIVLSGLSPSTTYHLRVKSSDEEDNIVTSQDYSFMTNILTNSQISVSRDLPPAADTGVPFDVDLIVDVNENNMPAIYILREKIPDGFIVLSNNGGTFNHFTNTLEWTVMDPIDYTFTYRIKTSSRGNFLFNGFVELMSSSFSVTGENVLEIGGGNDNPDDPGDETPPVISSVSASSSSISALITWMTDEPGTSIVEYGKTTAYGNTLTDTNLVRSHSMSLSGLEALTTYHYRVKSADASDNQADSADYTFTTTNTSSFPITNNVEVLDSARMPASTIQAGAQCHIKVASTNEDTTPITSTQIVEIMDGLTPVYILTMQSTINAGETDTNTYGFNVPGDAQPGKVYTVKVLSWDRLMPEGIPQIQAVETQVSFTVE